MKPSEWIPFEEMLTKEEQEAVGISQDRDLTLCIVRLASAYTHARQLAKRRQQLLQLLQLNEQAQQDVQSSHNRLVRQLDVLWNGEHAAEQAKLCDLVSQIAADLKKHPRNPEHPAQT
jgi:hypothetical protein